MRRVAALFLGLCVIVGGVLWWMTAPESLAAGYAAEHEPDAEAGRLVFVAAGCASCHAAPGAEGPDRLVLAGGQAFASDFGTFYAPNISPHPEAGIGTWGFEEFAQAVTLGVSPEGAHYYPAFPYLAYQRMTPGDVRDLFAYITTLPPAAQPSRPHDVAFPFNLRRGLGLWKWMFADPAYVLTAPQGAAETRGRYLAEALAHCGECHTPRNALGALQRQNWLGGAPHPSGKGRIPNITPAALTWSESDLVGYFATGFTPDYDTAGGEMAAVVQNLAQLPQEDRAALAAYLKAVPPVPVSEPGAPASE